MVFSDIVACATDVRFPFLIFLLFSKPHHTDDALDLEVLPAATTALGGQWRTGLTRDIIHLFALRPSSDKYETAMHFQADTHTKAVLPSALVG
jgi:mediator of DNA damage checkpoint protein 1